LIRSSVFLDYQAGTITSSYVLKMQCANYNRYVGSLINRCLTLLGNSICIAGIPNNTD